MVKQILPPFERSRTHGSHIELKNSEERELWKERDIGVCTESFFFQYEVNLFLKNEKKKIGERTVQLSFPFSSNIAMRRQSWKKF
jgi:hypothetical protein